MITNSSIKNPITKSLLQKKKMNGYRKYWMELNIENLNLQRVKRAHILKFEEENNDSEFGLDGEEATDETLKMLGTFIKSTNRRQELEISCEWGEETSDEGIRFVCEKIRGMTSLRRLSLSFHACWRVTDVGMFLLGRTLKTLSSLQSIKLSFSRCHEITEVGKSYISRMLRTLGRLRELSLGFHGYEIDSTQVRLRQTLKPLSSLRSLNLNCSENSNMVDDELNHIAKALKTRTSLESVSLNFK